MGSGVTGLAEALGRQREVSRIRIHRMSTQGVAWLAKLEGGLQTKAYKDAGHYAISAGVNFIEEVINLDDCWPPGTVTAEPRTHLVTRRVSADDEVTAEEALALFEGAIGSTEVEVGRVTRDDLTQSQYDALCSFCYNVGPSAFAKSTLLKLINDGPSIAPDLIAKQWRRWVHAELDPKAAGLEWSSALVRRREDEIACFFGGEYRVS
jgi:GH24 family phage-related lysozyme (muramidase)